MKKLRNLWIFCLLCNFSPKRKQSLSEDKTMDPELELLLIDKHDGWSTVYQHICYEAQQRFELSYSDSRRPEFRNRNRYKDISPYDHSRIRLKRNNIDYINASRIEVPEAKRSYILTQGPLAHTVGHFWLMVWEKKCPAILMLNRLVEKEQPKCHPYHPSDRGNKEEVLELDDVGLKVMEISEQKDDLHFTKRVFKLEDAKTGETHIVHHFHYFSWPDFGVPPSPDSFLDFLFSVRKSGVLESQENPVVVHCSAGVGRSGVFCLVDACLVIAQTCKEVNLRGKLIDIRRYRMGLIQTPQQLRFSYVALVQALIKLNLAKGMKAEDIPSDVEHEFLAKNFAETPTEDDLEDDEETEFKLNSSNNFACTDRSNVTLRSGRKGSEKKNNRYSLGRFMPHQASIDDPESLWLMNNTTITGEPLVGPGVLRDDEIVTGGRKSKASLGSKVDADNNYDGENGLIEDSSESEEDNEDCGGDDDDDEGCFSPEIIIKRRPLEERKKKSWEEMKLMKEKQDESGIFVEMRRKAWRLKLIGWSIVVAAISVVIAYRSS